MEPAKTAVRALEFTAARALKAPAEIIARAFKFAAVKSAASSGEILKTPLMTAPFI